MRPETLVRTAAPRPRRSRPAGLLLGVALLAGCAAPPRVQPGRIVDESRGSLEAGAVSREAARQADATRRAAEAGDPEASAVMGLLYQTGQGVPRNIDEAARWFRRAAERDDCAGQYHLGLLHLQGKGVPKNIDEAAHWLRRAEAHSAAVQRRSFRSLYRALPPTMQGIALRGADGTPGDEEMEALRNAEVAQVSYLQGMAYVEGDGVPVDPGLAMRFFDLAADRGHTEAQYAMGRAYLQGVGTSRDLVKAAQWLAIAAASGHEGAERDLQELEAALSPDEIAEAEALALQWRRDRRSP